MIFEESKDQMGINEFLYFPRYVESKDRAYWATLWLERVTKKRNSNGSIEYTSKDGRKWTFYGDD